MMRWPVLAMRRSRRLKGNARPAVKAFILLAAVVSVVAVFVSELGAQQAPTEASSDSRVRLRAVMPANFRPEYNVDDSGKPAGFAVDSIREIARLAGIEIDFAVKPSWAEVHEEIRRGRGDLVPLVGITDDRTSIYKFTQPYQTLAIRLWIRSTDPRGDIAKGNITNHTIAAVRDNAAIAELRRREVWNIVVVDSLADAIAALMSGEVDAFAYPEQATRNTIESWGIDQRIQAVGAPLIETKRGVGLSYKLSPEIAQRFDRAVGVYKYSAAYKVAITRWYGQSLGFWTVETLLWAFGIGFAVVAGGFAFFHYAAVLHVNRRLATREVELREIVDSVADAIVSIDEAGRIVSWNRAAERTFGYGKREIVGRNVSVMMPEPHRSRHDSYIGAFLQGGQGNFVGKGPRELMAMRQDGVPVPIELAINEMPQGAAARFIGVARDLTVSHAARERLRLREQQLHILTDALPLAIAHFDRDGRYLFVNKVVEYRNGLPRSEILGRTMQEIVGSKFARRKPYFARALAGEQVTFSEEFAMPTGEFRSGVRTYIPQIDETGKVIGVFSLGEDVTERRAIQAQLFQAQKMEAVGQLTGGIAHDFNNLLTIIIGNLQMIEDARPKPDDQDWRAFGGIIERRVRAAHKAAERGADLISKLLAFSRKQVLAPKVVDLAELLPETAELLHRSLGEGISLNIDLPPDPWHAYVDPAQLQGALVNLAINANDAMGGKGTLTIAVANITVDGDYAVSHGEARAGDFAVVSVSDTGSGIPPEIIGQIFEPFFTTKGLRRGSGLGLSMVHGFVTQSGGFVNVYSEEGRGSTFKLYLPRALAEKPANGNAPKLFRVDADRHAGTLILVVEDEPEVRDIVVTALKQSGFEVIEAENFNTAMEALKRRPDTALMLTDVVMPGGRGGGDLAHEAMRLRPKLQIIFMSGYPSSHLEQLQEFVHVGEVLAKPFDSGDVVKAVIRALDAAE